VHLLLLDVTIALHDSLATHFIVSFAPVLRSVADNIHGVLGPDVLVDIAFTAFALNAESTCPKAENTLLSLDWLDPRSTCALNVLDNHKASGDPPEVSSI
jgi:hypothetical protein